MFPSRNSSLSTAIMNSSWLMTRLVSLLISAMLFGRVLTKGNYFSFQPLHLLDVHAYQPLLFRIFLSHISPFVWLSRVCRLPEDQRGRGSSGWREPSSPQPHRAAGPPCPPQRFYGSDTETSFSLSSKKWKVKILRIMKVDIRISEEKHYL